jgi:hypothetical protein
MCMFQFNIFGESLGTGNYITLLEHFYCTNYKTNAINIRKAELCRMGECISFCMRELYHCDYAISIYHRQELSTVL